MKHVGAVDALRFQQCIWSFLELSDEYCKHVGTTTREKFVIYLLHTVQLAYTPAS